MPKVAFYTLGCRLNQAEEEDLRRQFMAAGFNVGLVSEADIVIINTCSVTHVADKKSRQAIKRLKAQGQEHKAIVVMGCGANEAKGIEGVDLFIPNKEKSQAFHIITKEIKLASLHHASEANISKKGKRTRALLKVQDGCNNFCAYCIVPHLRGREVSVPLAEVINEAKKLEGLGYKELVISGVNVGQYELIKNKNVKIKNNGLAGLLEHILKETNFPRIRLSSVNPQDITDELIDLWATESRLCNHFHLSLQSGSDGVLKRMGRPYDTKKYLEVTQKIKKAMPDAAITTDVIVGFPGETEEEFAETCEFVRQVGFAKLHVFPYSKRQGTKAAEMEGQVEDEVKKERAKKLREIGDNLRREYLSQFIGQKLPVLFEEKKGDYWYGLTSNYIRVKHRSKENLENIIRDIAYKQ